MAGSKRAFVKRGGSVAWYGNLKGSLIRRSIKIHSCGRRELAVPDLSKASRRFIDSSKALREWRARGGVARSGRLRMARQAQLEISTFCGSQAGVRAGKEMGNNNR